VGFDARGRKLGADKSDKVFTIEVLRLTTPKDGQVLISDTDFNITWETNDTKSSIADVNVYYSKDGGVSWLPIDVGPPHQSNRGYFVWKVPLAKAPKTRCKIKVVLKKSNWGAVGSGVTHGYFTIRPPA